MKRRYILFGSVAVVIIILLSLPLLRGGVEQENKVVTATPSIGTITNTITATGTVEPIDQVEVGTQVSGVINKLYVDFNSRVKKGQVLAEIDRSKLNEQLAQSKASLASAQNEVTYQGQNLKRVKELFASGMSSQTDLELAEYKYNSAKATLDRTTSELEQARVNLGYATIYSPIDGVVLSRSVEEGQTVAASFNTPTLFTIANDLTKMQVEADVDEADIGQVNVGQKVTFTVDAYPDDTFNGVIKQVRLKPQVASNVVTYVVIVDAPNPDQKLKPGLTASISVVTKEALNTMLLSAKATKFTPTVEQQLAYKLSLPQEATSKRVKGEATVWVKNGNSIEPKIITVGMEDGATIQVVNGLTVEDSVVLSIEKVSFADAKKQSSSPFMPKMPSPKGKNSAK